MTETDIMRRMDAFESRLQRLETLLGGTDPARVPRPEEAIQEKIFPTLSEALVEPCPPKDVTSAPPEETWPEATPLTEPVLQYRSFRPEKHIARSDLEQTIGLKWAGWVGAVVLVIGAGLGIKFGYDQGWFRVVPPVARLIAFAIAGFGLIAAGEWVYRRVNVLSAVGLFGAGVAVLFVVSYSGYAYYDLYPRDTAFVLMAISTVIGAAVARRGNMVSIAVLSLIGGNLAPLLLSNGQPVLIGFLVYLLMLQLVAMILAAWGSEPKWWALRGLSLATTSLWMLAMIHESTLTMVIFSIVFAGLYQLELLFSASRSRLHSENAGATFSLLVSAALTAIVLYLLLDASESLQLGFIVGFALVTGIWAVVCSAFANDFVPMRRMTVAYAVQSVALIVVAVPIAFSGVWISCAWGVLAVALAVLGHLLDLRAARQSAPAVWALALGYLCLWTGGADSVPHRNLVGLSIEGVDFHQYTLMYFLLAILGQVIAKLMATGRRTPVTADARQNALVMSVASSSVWLLSSITILPAMAATVTVLTYSLLIALLDWLDADLDLLLQATVITTLAAAKWVVLDTLVHRISDPQTAQPIVLGINGLTSTMLLINLAAMYVRAVAAQGGPRSVQIKRVAFISVVAIFFCLGTFGIDQAFINLRLSNPAAMVNADRAEQVALSVFWSFFAIASIAAGFGWRVAGLRYAGLGLFALTLLKVVLIDLNQVSTGYRILSFMGLGLLLLGTSVLYGKLSPVLLAAGQASSNEPQADQFGA